MRVISVSLLVLTACGTLTEPVDRAGEHAREVVDRAASRATALVGEAVEAAGARAGALVTQAGLEARRSAEDAAGRLRDAGTALVDRLGDRTHQEIDHAGDRLERAASRAERAIAAVPDATKRASEEARGFLDYVLAWLRDFGIWVASAVGIVWTWREKLKRARAERTADVLVRAVDQEDAEPVRRRVAAILKDRKDEYAVRAEIKRRRERTRTRT